VRPFFMDTMKTFFIALLLTLPLHGRAAAEQSTVTLLQFSDYHSHALPFYTDAGMRGGIARAVRFLRDEKRRGALVFSGGDTINKGAPAWSDKYGCAEWPWLNGVVDAMTFGNHDADYGVDAFARCRADVRYPILSANTAGFPRYRVFTARGVRVGVFAVAGSDFPKLVHVAGFTFGDPVAAARDVVRELRERERVDAVVLIGHEHLDADFALARAVPGIDLIFGSHSHLRRDLMRIPDTNTWFISPGQYLEAISRVELTIANHAVTSARGGLVEIDERLPEDRAIARNVGRMQRALERDPHYSAQFAVIANLRGPLTIAALAQRTLELMRNAAHANVALSTFSSFRQALPAGPLTLEQLTAALPYENEIVVCTMSGAQLQRVLDYSAARRGTDGESYIAAPLPLDVSRNYRVATTDFLANVAYKEVFNCTPEKTGLHVRETLRKSL